MLQNAHAGEIAAYRAYEGHWRSLKNIEESAQVKLIQKEELEHIHLIEEFLEDLGAKPNKFLDFIFSLIGRFLSAGCYVSGYFAPMYVARIIERIGKNNYNLMADEAHRLGLYTMCLFLRDMSEVEEDHEKYFASKT